MNSLIDILLPELKWEIQRFCANPPKAPHYYIKCTGIMDGFLCANPSVVNRVYSLYHFFKGDKFERNLWYFSNIRNCECVLPQGYEEVTKCYLYYLLRC